MAAEGGRRELAAVAGGLALCGRGLIGGVTGRALGRHGAVDFYLEEGHGVEFDRAEMCRVDELSACRRKYIDCHSLGDFSMTFCATISAPLSPPVPSVPSASLSPARSIPSLPPCSPLPRLSTPPAPFHLALSASPPDLSTVDYAPLPPRSTGKHPAGLNVFASGVVDFLSAAKEPQEMVLVDQSSGLSSFEELL